MPYTVHRSNNFKRQYRRLQWSGNTKLAKELDDIIILLVEGKKLPDKNRNHRLFGDLNDCWECHIAYDWLLIYRYHHDLLVLELVATGSHNDLF